EAGNRSTVGVEYALSHGTNWVNCEKLIIPYYSMRYAIYGVLTCGFRNVICPHLFVLAHLFPGFRLRSIRATALNALT
ncbi:MAG: hypothetical protein Q8M09_00195, partial [Pseudomonadota bacterium]|nr:hypothetical protein [Pseudomonadota bacterium]